MTARRPGHRAGPLVSGLPVAETVPARQLDHAMN
jgi:hypothetical protein